MDDDDKRCLVSAGRPSCGDATHGIVRDAPGNGRPGVEFVKVSPVRETDYHVWVRAPRGGIEASSALVYVFDQRGLVGSQTYAAAPLPCAAETIHEGADCAFYDDPSFVDDAAPVWASPTNWFLSEHTSSVCLRSARVDGAFRKTLRETQRHYTARGWDRARLVDECGAAPECDFVDDDAWHCSRLIERGIFRCPGAARRMRFCDVGSKCVDAGAPAASSDEEVRRLHCSE